MSGDIVEYRCDYSNGPVKPFLTFVEEGWEISRTGLTDSWTDRLEADLKEAEGESGVLRLYVRATEDAEPGMAEIRIEFRGGDFATDAPKDEVILRQTLLEPTPTPSPTPTPEPAIAFAPDMECTSAGTVGSGQDLWTVRDCEATWETEHMKTVELTASVENSAWDVVAVDADSADVSGLNAADATLTLTDSDQDDDGFYSARFSIGTRITACTSDESAAVSIAFEAISHQPVPEDEDGNPLVDISTSPEETETVSRSMTARTDAPDAPSVRIETASFTPINYGAGERTSTGTIKIRYDDAPPFCDWGIVLDIGEFSGTMSESELQFVNVDGAPVTTSIDDLGAIILTGNGDELPESGVLTVTMKLTLDGYTAHGQYQTTVNVRSELLP